MALAAVTAAALALAIDLLPALQTHHLHTGVFALVALADQGISNPRKVYLVGLASHDERPFCIAVSNVVGGVVGMAIAFIFGAIAHLQGVEWPLWLIIGLNVAAALYTIRLPTLKPGRSPTGHTSGIASNGP